MQTMQNETERRMRQAEEDYATAILLLDQGRYSACAFHYDWNG